MATTASPFLMFQNGDAEEAMTFYTGLFADGQVLDVAKYGADGPGHEGTIMVARFTVAGQEIRCSDSPVQHGFGFTPSVSLWVEAESDDELERLFGALADGGGTLMPLGDYGFSRRFGWVNDRFGVSWQLNLA